MTNGAEIIRRELMIRLVRAFDAGNLAETIDRIPVEMRPRDAPFSRSSVWHDRAVLKYRIMALLGFSCENETDEARTLRSYLEEMREAMERAEAAGSERKATRFVVTDFSDGYAWHPLCVSLPAIILAGNLMTAGRVAAKMDLEKDLCSVMDLPVGGLLQKLGTLYLRGGAVRPDSSEYFNILAGDVGYSRHPGLTQFVLDDVSAVARGVRIALERWLERSDWAKEISYAALLLECSCHRRDERRLRELRDLHGLTKFNKFTLVTAQDLVYHTHPNYQQ